jgi:hypothetical protein
MSRRTLVVAVGLSIGLPETYGRRAHRPSHEHLGQDAGQLGCDHAGDPQDDAHTAGAARPGIVACRSRNLPSDLPAQLPQGEHGLRTRAGAWPAHRLVRQTPCVRNPERTVRNWCSGSVDLRVDTTRTERRAQCCRRHWTTSIPRSESCRPRSIMDSSTTVILSAKHGQLPEDLGTLRRVKDGTIIDNLNAAWAASHPNTAPLLTFAVDDDAMLTMTPC